MLSDISFEIRILIKFIKNLLLLDLKLFMRLKNSNLPSFIQLG